MIPRQKLRPNLIFLNFPIVITIGGGGSSSKGRRHIWEKSIFWHFGREEEENGQKWNNDKCVGNLTKGSMYKMCNCPGFFLWPPKYDNVRIIAGRAGENRWGQQLRNSNFTLIKHKSRLFTFTSKGQLKPPIYDNGAFLCATERERRRGEKRNKDKFA